MRVKYERLLNEQHSKIWGTRSLPLAPSRDGYEMVPSSCCGSRYVSHVSDCNAGITISFSENPLEEVTDEYYINSVKLADNCYMLIKHRTNEKDERDYYEEDEEY